MSVCGGLGVSLHSLPVFLPFLSLFLRPRGGKESSKFRHLRQVRRRRRVPQLSGMKCTSSLDRFLPASAWLSEKAAVKDVKGPCSASEIRKSCPERVEHGGRRRCCPSALSLCSGVSVSVAQHCRRELRALHPGLLQTFPGATRVSIWMHT